MFELNLFDNISLSLNNAWWLSLTYFITATASVLMIPKHNLRKFLDVPKVPFHTRAGQGLYYILLILPVFMPFSDSLALKISGFIFFLIGILLYLSGIFFFAISEYDKPATEGIYKIIKHPVYTGFFIILASISIATGSIIYLFLVILYILNSKYLKQAEEQICREQYGKEYQYYIDNVMFKSL